MMLPTESSVTPGISLLPRTRGPIPERKRKFPTRLACGHAPTGSGARLLSKVSLIFLTADYTDNADLFWALNKSTLNNQLPDGRYFSNFGSFGSMESHGCAFEVNMLYFG